MNMKKLILYLISALSLCAMSIGFASPTPSPTPREPGKMSKEMERNAKSTAVPSVKGLIYVPPPDYPYEARSRRLRGSGVGILTVDTASGRVTNVTIAKSTGSAILDNAARSTFWKCRFQPGTVSKVKVPITFAP